MQAVIQNSFKGINDLQIKTLPDSQLSPLSAMIETHYTPILPWDWLMEEGRLQQLNPVKIPRIIGYGFAGVVVQVGSMRNRSLINQKVVGVHPGGSHVTTINSKIPPLLFSVPSNVDLAAAVTIIGGADAALMAQWQSHIHAHDIVLVIGASGGVGTYLIQLLKLTQAKVIAIARTQSHRQLIELGADYVVDYQYDFKEQLQEVPVPNKVIDCVGSAVLLDTIVQQYDELQIFSLSRQHYRTLKTSQTFNFSNQNIGLKGYQQLLQMLSTGQIQAVIQTQFNFRDVKQAQQVSKSQPSQGRILLNYKRN
ncbi:quinone oxidoreductase family protein [Bombilactobacillus bombi]|uniref:quinone oxidoreductase family protein n=1 Tax=Bombilactobacillus bombi TaxID=1303590 RepID=UPI0015E59FA3|nr:zinc-binding dehydrogenase [Bombilactobacillus bombi]MBA1433879.1 NADP-dependent oxidoreductase [Bombilactobacillus bombi]